MKSDGHRAGRIYAVWMQPNLFGEWVVVCAHGGRRHAAVILATEGQVILSTNGTISAVAANEEESGEAGKGQVVLTAVTG